ncbi:hypothetical protein CY34DRAFT_107508 [Suillus luteus UH-Slu-Lm8-n1]|uniref:Uncharacterized protein n=1 Tax=Suillus luteus UH-Slu-Lm8-n1 TaxID=930992 RepID=A0A0D0BC79_9AGAM|nr:hypothetical protein CY34DRAFT_107508 [Suillus luteus UH-Slu-Lm8-n1]
MAPDRLQTRANIATDRLRGESQREKFAARASDRKTVVLELDEAGETLCVWYCYHHEAAMIVLTRGPHAGEYVACCASIFIKQIHQYSGVPVKNYPRRNADEPRPHEIVFLDGNDIKLEDVIQRRQLRRHETNLVFDKLLKLDSFCQPGLTQAEFHHFLTRCNGCDLIMTRRMFEHHDCVGSGMRRGNSEKTEVIDLTSDSEGDNDK